MLDDFQIGVPIEVQSWEGSSINNLNLIQSSVTTFKDFGTSNTVLLPHQTHLLETNQGVPQSQANQAEGTISDDEDGRSV